MGRFIRTAAATAVACLVVVGASAAAGSAGSPGGPEERGLMVAAAANGVVSTVFEDKVCEQARSRSQERGPCAAEAVGGATAAEVATAAQLAGDGNLVSADGLRLHAYRTSLRAKAARPTTTPVGTIWTRTWWQEARGLYYINWWEKHSGRIYWHDGHVWSTTLTHGYKGYHVCDQGGGIGYDIKVTSCFTERLSTNHIYEWDYWKVYVFFEGFPISASHNMHASAWGSGNIYFYW